MLYFLYVKNAGAPFALKILASNVILYHSLKPKAHFSYLMASCSHSPFNIDFLLCSKLKEWRLEGSKNINWIWKEFEITYVVVWFHSWSYNFSSSLFLSQWKVSFGKTNLNDQDSVFFSNNLEEKKLIFFL